MLYILYIPIEILKLITGIIIYPIAFLFRDWARERVYDINYDYITRTVHGGEGTNPMPWSITKKKYSFWPLDIIAVILWWYLDDTPEYLDAGGTWFHRNVCNNDSGCEKTLFHMQPKITNKWRYFCCSYRWSVFKNRMVNFSRDILTPHKYIDGYYVYYNTVDQDIPIKEHTIIKPTGTRYKTNDDGTFNPDKSVLGMQIYATITTDNNWYYCIEATKVFNFFGMKFYIDFWYGYLRGTLRFEGRPGIGIHRV